MWSPRREATLRLANHHYDKAIQLMSSMPSGLDYLKATTLKKQLERLVMCPPELRLLRYFYRATKASVSIDSVPRSVTGYAKILRTHFQNPERYRAESEKLCELARVCALHSLAIPVGSHAKDSIGVIGASGVRSLEPK